MLCARNRAPRSIAQAKHPAPEDAVPADHAACVVANLDPPRLTDGPCSGICTGAYLDTARRPGVVLPMGLRCGARPMRTTALLLSSFGLSLSILLSLSTAHDAAAKARKRSGVDLSDVQVTKEFDKASPKLLAKGKRPKKQNQEPYMQYQMNDVMISRTSGGSQPPKGPNPGILQGGPGGFQMQNPSATGAPSGAAPAAAPSGRIN